MPRSPRSTSPLNRSNRPALSTDGNGTSWLDRLPPLLLGLILAARLLVPTEGAVQGDTLWIVQFSFAAVAILAWIGWRRGDAAASFTLFDAAVWLLVAGHVLSALAVVVVGGQQRSAVNMLWEWLGLGATAWLVGRIVRDSEAARRVVLAMLATAVALAGLGLWQHYVWYPQTVREYQSVRAELDRLTGEDGAALGAADARRVRELQLELLQQDIPLEGTARQMWETRLTASSEPFGTFALANTFAGVLAVWLLVAGGLFAECLRTRHSVLSTQYPVPSTQESGTHHSPLTTHAPLLVALALIGFCLLLTKSRTAWVGLMAGAMTAGLMAFRLRRSRPSQWLRPGDPSVPADSPHRLGEEEVGVASTPQRFPSRLTVGLAGVAILIGLMGVAAATGGFDRAVLSEAPKSVQYRLQYWTAAWQVVREHPWLGVGPGNFRQHYLRYKLPESSEEIADPHNLVLDVWTSGGLLGVLGLAAVIVAAGRVFVTACRSAARTGGLTPPARPLGIKEPLVLGAGLGFALLFGFEWLLGLDWGREVALLAGFAAAVAALRPAVAAGSIPLAGLAAGFVALLVHLIGAGGIEMPAIVQTLLLLPLLASGLSPKEAGSPGRRSGAFHLAVSVVALVLFAGCLLTATGPVWNRQTLISAGDFALLSEGRPRDAEAHYRAAAAADRLSPDPPGRLANLHFQQWQSQPSSAAADFEKTVEWQRRAIALDPHSPFGYRGLGEWHLKRFQRTKAAGDASAAVDALTTAVQRYPTSATLRSLLAQALLETGDGDAARRQAEAAMRLDEINRREGHADKILPDSVRREVEAILRPVAPSSRPVE